MDLKSGTIQFQQKKYFLLHDFQILGSGDSFIFHHHHHQHHKQQQRRQQQEQHQRRQQQPQRQQRRQQQQHHQHHEQLNKVSARSKLIRDLYLVKPQIQS